MQVERLVGRLNIPASNTLRRSLLSLARNEDYRACTRLLSSTSANINPETYESSDEHTPSNESENELSGGWRRHTDLRSGWVDVFSTPILSLIIMYTYHPILPGETFENIQDRCQACSEDIPQQPTDLEPDVISLELNANACAFKLIGMVFKALVNIKVSVFQSDFCKVKSIVNKVVILFYSAAF